jgi:glycerate 2-kinase
MIKNAWQLIDNAQDLLLQKARYLTLGALENALKATEPRTLLLSKVKLQESLLLVDGLSFDLKRFKHVYVVGGGKAGAAMAQATEELLGSYITEGIVNVPYGSTGSTQTVKLHHSSHPLPDQSGVEGAGHMLAIAEQAQEDDLVLCLLSGGGSSLMSLPRDNVTLHDKQAITEALLNSAANITEINAVRKHLSRFKGGWLAKQAYPAPVLNLILSDVIDDPLDIIASGPTVPDQSTFQDAVDVLKRHGLWDRAPLNVRRLFELGVDGSVSETPKPDAPAFQKVYNVLIGNNQSATDAAAQFLRSQQVNVHLLSKTMTGEAKAVGNDLACEARAKWCDKREPKPVAVVAGGETTVTVWGKGVGGRNQEVALSAAKGIKGVKGCVVASLGTDGVDGPTDAAGAIVDCCTIFRAQRLGLDVEDFLKRNDSYNFFKSLGDLIVTGPTGTNVSDLFVIVVLGEGLDEAYLEVSGRS